jgi:mitochondrial fission protein ELM1
VQDTVIWRFSDGKAGHDRQSQGLVHALRRRTPVAEYVFTVDPGRRVLGWWLRGCYPPAEHLPRPDLLIGAGHATHLHLLAARRCCGGRAVVLMKPSLPCRWFDLCLVPEHDQARPAANVLLTQGVLNTIQPGGEHRSDSGLIVVGGLSQHYRWDNAAVLEQIRTLLARRPLAHWRLATSRRTPTALLESAQRLEGVECFGVDPERPDRLPAQLAQAGEVWVTEDSVSMIFEALSSGARVGLLAVPRARANRVTAGVDRLISRCQVGAPGQWQALAGQTLLNEAARCADWIQERWLNVH